MKKALLITVGDSVPLSKIQKLEECVPPCPIGIDARPTSCSLESRTAGLQSLCLASWLKPWLVIIDGL